MSYVYSDPSRESETYSLPNVEIFYLDATEAHEWNRDADPDYEPGATGVYGEGWYYRFGFPGYMPDGDPCGPYDSEADAVEAAREE